MFKISLIISSILLTTSVACAQQSLVPSVNNMCPEGTQPVGAGYCQGKHYYVPSAQSMCPEGTHNAGNGYCQLDKANQVSQYYTIKRR